MNTRHLNNRDRDWARITIFRWKHGRGRQHSSAPLNRMIHAEDAKAFLAGNDPAQQQALSIKP